MIYSRILYCVFGLYCFFIWPAWSTRLHAKTRWRRWPSSRFQCVSRIPSSLTCRFVQLKRDKDCIYFEILFYSLARVNECALCCIFSQKLDFLNSKFLLEFIQIYRVKIEGGEGGYEIQKLTMTIKPKNINC